jgi:serine/threonine protein kinase
MDAKTEIPWQPNTKFGDRRVPRLIRNTGNYFLDPEVPVDQPGRGWFVVKSVFNPTVAQSIIKFNFVIWARRNVAVLVGSCPDADSSSFSLEPYTGSDLSTALAKKTFWEEDIWRVSFDILVGIRSIHRRSYVHRDIRPETILMTGSGKVYVGDFGTSALLPGGCPLEGPLHQPVGTPHYMAPEFYQVPLEYDRAVDMWAFGVVLFEMVSRREEPSCSPQSLNDVFEWGLYMVTRLRQFRVSAELKKVITSLLDLAPERRPTAARLLRHPFYQRELSARKEQDDWASDSDSDSDQNDPDDHPKDDSDEDDACEWSE